MAPKGHGGSRTGVNAFNAGSAYLFRHYFDEDAVFARLGGYYEAEQYRFAVPAGEFDGLRRILREYGYELAPVAALEPYTAVVRTYTAHPENVFGACVLQRSHGDHTLFVMKDRDAVDRAVDEGAVPLRESSLSVRIGEQRRLSAV